MKLFQKLIPCFSLVVFGLVASGCSNHEVMPDDDYDVSHADSGTSGDVDDGFLHDESSSSLENLSSSEEAPLSSSSEASSSSEVTPLSSSLETSSSSESVPSSSSVEYSSSSEVSSSSEAASLSSSVGYSSSSEVSSSSESVSLSSSSIVDGSSYDAESGDLKDFRGHLYATVTIGTQVWMAEDLKYNYNVASAESFCYGDRSANCTLYGRLYEWSAAVDSAGVFSSSAKGCGSGNVCTIKSNTVRGACPYGWHIPSKKDWETLLSYVGGKERAAPLLMATETWVHIDDYTPNDKYGFWAMASGIRLEDGSYSSMATSARYWAVDNDSDEALCLDLSSDNVDVKISSISKSNAISVRCLKD